MSEKEIIKNTKVILEHYRKIKNIKDPIERDIESSCYIEEMPFNELQGLLDLYYKQQKEIEELKAFYNSFESREIVNYPIFKQRYISKDTIREKIKINEELIKEPSHWKYADNENKIFEIENMCLEELLEE